MSTLSVARRYAAALFDVARKSGTEERVGEQLAAFAGLVAGHADLQRAVDSRAIPVTAKKTLVAALIDASGDMTAELKRALLLLAERDRLGALPEVTSSYRDRLMLQHKVTAAEVTTAVPLSPEHRATLTAALRKAAGGEVTVTEHVDPSIVGGVVARVGSVVYDGSVQHQLDRLRETLAAQR
ncbi:MAG TPA: ATP synthase F1 subunit delta [Vicinamibacterales bacterium]|nr:ATP synthase F1 subunit delta [Vicinamibacterales bacterium]